MPEGAAYDGSAWVVAVLWCVWAGLGWLSEGVCATLEPWWSLERGFTPAWEWRARRHGRV